MLAPDTKRVAGRHTDTACQPDRGAEPVYAHICYSPENALRNGTGSGGIRTAQDDYELLAAITANDIRLPQLSLNGSDDRSQARVTRRMPTRVIDLLEVVQINEQQSDRQPLRSRPQSGFLQPLNERSAIQHPGQRIGLRAVFCLGVCEPLLAQPVCQAKGNQHR